MGRAARSAQADRARGSRRAARVWRAGMIVYAPVYFLGGLVALDIDGAWAAWWADWRIADLLKGDAL